MLKLNIIDMKGPGSYASDGDVRAQRSHAYQAEMLQTEANSAGGCYFCGTQQKLFLLSGAYWSLCPTPSLPPKVCIIFSHHKGANKSHASYGLNVPSSVTQFHMLKTTHRCEGLGREG